MALDLPPLPLYERVFGTAWMKWLRVLRDRLVIGENWQFVTFKNSWTDYAGDVGRYYKDAIGTVHLRARVANGAAIPSTVFTLPEGYRPEYTLYFPVVANGAFGYVNVQPDGDVIILAGSTIWTSLAGITFKAL